MSHMWTEHAAKKLPDMMILDLQLTDLKNISAKEKVTGTVHFQQRENRSNPGQEGCN